jgi:hypothetical protein
MKEKEIICIEHGRRPARFHLDRPAQLLRVPHTYYPTVYVVVLQLLEETTNSGLYVNVAAGTSADEPTCL